MQALTCFKVKLYAYSAKALYEWRGLNDVNVGNADGSRWNMRVLRTINSVNTVKPVNASKIRKIHRVCSYEMQALYHLGEPLSVMFNGSFTPNLKASTWQVRITN